MHLIRALAFVVNRKFQQAIALGTAILVRTFLRGFTHEVDNGFRYAVQRQRAGTRAVATGEKSAGGSVNANCRQVRCVGLPAKLLRAAISVQKRQQRRLRIAGTNLRTKLFQSVSLNEIKLS
jgi:hypothetical protein